VFHELWRESGCRTWFWQGSHVCATRRLGLISPQTVFQVSPGFITIRLRLDHYLIGLRINEFKTYFGRSGARVLGNDWDDVLTQKYPRETSEQSVVKRTPASLLHRPRESVRRCCFLQVYLTTDIGLKLRRPLVKTDTQTLRRSRVRLLSA